MSRPDFETLVAEHRGELFAHCYRMLGSPQDAEDVLQEALVGAWRGYAGFEGRSSVRTWLYTIATNACLQHLRREQRRRTTTPDLGPAYAQTEELGEPVAERYVEPLATDPEASYLERESLELAFVAALQHLPPNQRAVLVLREVLQLSAAEVAAMLGTTPASVNSALQRARATVDARVPQQPQQAELAALGDAGVRRLVDEFLTAWENADLDRLTALLADDVRFTMPPLPAWFDGLAMVRRFLAERVLATRWALEPVELNGQPGLRCRQETDGVLAPAAVLALALSGGRVGRIESFVDPVVVERFFVDR